MKKIILTNLITTILLLSGFYILAKVIDFNKALPTDKYTEQDVKDTDVNKAILTANWLGIDFDIDRNVFFIKIDYPQLKIDGTDYKVEKTENIVEYYLNDYNECRNLGNDKAACVDMAKTIIKTQVNQYKESVKIHIRTFQEELEKINYMTELTKDDLIMTTEELNE